MKVETKIRAYVMMLALALVASSERAIGGGEDGACGGSEYPMTTADTYLARNLKTIEEADDQELMKEMWRASFECSEDSGTCGLVAIRVNKYFIDGQPIHHVLPDIDSMTIGEQVSRLRNMYGDNLLMEGVYDRDELDLNGLKKLLNEHLKKGDHAIVGYDQKELKTAI